MSSPLSVLLLAMDHTVSAQRSQLRSGQHRRCRESPQSRSRSPGPGPPGPFRPHRTLSASAGRAGHRIAARAIGGHQARQRLHKVTEPTVGLLETLKLFEESDGGSRSRADGWRGESMTTDRRSRSKLSGVRDSGSILESVRTSVRRGQWGTRFATCRTLLGCRGRQVRRGWGPRRRRRTWASWSARCRCSSTRANSRPTRSAGSSG